MIGMMKRRGLVFGIVGVFVAVALLAAAWRLNLQHKAGLQAGTAAEGVDLASASAVLKAARTYIGNQELKKAEAVLRAALETRPDDAVMRGLLGDVLLQGEDEAGAMAQYAEVADRADATAEALHKAGSLSAGMGDYPRAIGYLSRALELDASNVETPILLANAQLESGLVSEAKASLAMAGVLDEGRAMVWGMMAEIALRENRLEMATQHIAKARRLEAGSIPWRVLEARIARRAGAPDKAVLLLDGVRGEERFEPEVVAEMASALGMLGRGEDAFAIYQVAVRERPADAELRYQAAVWAERLGYLDQARDLAQSASMMGDERAKALVDRLPKD